METNKCGEIFEISLLLVSNETGKKYQYAIIFVFRTNLINFRK
jgi:hypothetical protein